MENVYCMAAITIIIILSPILLSVHFKNEETEALEFK